MASTDFSPTSDITYGYFGFTSLALGQIVYFQLIKNTSYDKIDLATLPFVGAEFVRM
tara:strand:- start:2613 stop:2783 length:171 start_codon:yes stop_codon:yes gene_type:complete